ncbi:MAG: hypothetical protein HKN16_07365 [Saprospiraceae bacterium]|nr:hypothetical protein [Saprospiraceae bacterium]
MKEPLDIPDIETNEEPSVPKKQLQISLLLELIPLALLAVGLLMSYRGNQNWRLVFSLGAVLTAIVFLVNNWILLWQENYKNLEIVLSVFSSLFFLIAIYAIYLQFFHLEQAHFWSRIGRVIGLILLLGTALGFLLRLSKPGFTAFYRRLLARLLVVFAVLIKGLF